MNLSRWRLAARVARREVRRHWVRSALVVVIIALPVLAAQGAAVAHRTDRVSTPAPGFDREGRIVEPQLAGADEMTGFDPRLGRPPALEGAVRVETGFQIQDWARVVGGAEDDLTRVQVVGFVPDASEVHLAAGRVPENRREAVVDRDLQRDADLAVGDRIEVVASGVELEIVGISASSTSWGGTAWAGPVVDGDDWVPAALAELRDSGNDWVAADMFDLYWLPEGVGPTMGDQLRTDIAYDAGGPTSESIVVATAGAAIAVGFVATICSAAFAIGARRQLRSLGILATAGAGPADLTRAVLLQGTALGLAGAATATVLVYAGRTVVARAVLDGRTWDVAWAPDLVLAVAALGVLAGTLAALVPALTASRIPTLSALAGRRPTRRRRLRSPWVGVVSFGLGMGALSWAGSAPRYGSGSGRAAAAAIGVLLAMAGSIAISPGVVSVLGRLCGRASGTIRLSGRSIARDGMRSAAIVATTAVAVALPVVVLVWGARDRGLDELSAESRADRARWEQALDDVGRADVGDGSMAVAAGDLVDDVRRILGPDTVTVRSTYTPTASSSGVDPDELERVTGDDAVADALRAGDAVGLARHPAGGYRDPSQLSPDGREVTLVEAPDVSDLTLVLLAEADALIDLADIDQTIDDGGWIVLRPTPLTDAEAREMTDLGYQDDAVPTYEELQDLAGGGGRQTGLSVYPYTPGSDLSEVPWGLIAFAASVVVALAIIGVASALGAADGRPDEQIVAAVGAPPSVVRRRRVLEATFTAAAAAVLGTGLGAVATLTVLHTPFTGTSGGDRVFHFPLLPVVGTAGGTVAVVGCATWFALAVSAGLRGRRDIVLADG